MSNTDDLYSSGVLLRQANHTDTATRRKICDNLACSKQSSIMQINSEGFPCRSISSLVGWGGPGSGFESLSSPPLLSENLVISPLGLGSKNNGFRTAMDITGQKCQGVAEIESFHSSFSRSSFSFMSQTLRVAA